MRLYHSRFLAYPIKRLIQTFLQAPCRLALLCLLVGINVFLMSGCSGPVVTQSTVEITIQVDGAQRQVQVSPGSTVHQALTAAGIQTGALDRTEPPLYVVVSEATSIRVVRVREEFEVQEATIPFEHQVLRNESMPEGETRLVQPGVNGSQEITFRRVYEDGMDISSSPVKVVIIKEPVPEITMVGSQIPFASFPIPGRLAYLVGGNAWVIEGSTGNRRPVVTTGDLDGRVFSLSPDSKWLLYSRRPRSDEDELLNSLWVAEVAPEFDTEQKLIDLNATNVVHFADWRPASSYVIAYSTVEPRASAPGWQANNDLKLIALSSQGEVKQLAAEMETNMGGTYGWWGINYAWSPDGLKMAYARPDSIGILDLGGGSLTSLLDVVPLNTRADWAWVPGLQWGSDSKTLFTVDHVSSRGVVSPEESPFFDLTAVPLEGGVPLHIVSQSGMFSYPLPSPLQTRQIGESASEHAYQVAYLQAIFPSQSDSSRYHVMLMDRDGSNRRQIFPPAGAPGLTPLNGWGAWSPAQLDDMGSFALAVLYQENLWLVDTSTGETRQITGDGLVTRLDWKGSNP